MRFKFNPCPDCGYVCDVPNIERTVYYDADNAWIVRAYCPICYWETGSHRNVKECAEEWNSTVIYAEDIKEEDTVKNNIKCPCCSESNYMYLYSDSTLAYCPPIYKDGVLISNECRNKSTDYYECMNCGAIFAYKNGVLDESYTTMFAQIEMTVSKDGL